MTSKSLYDLALAHLSDFSFFDSPPCLVSCSYTGLRSVLKHPKLVSVSGLLLLLFPPGMFFHHL